MEHSLLPRTLWTNDSKFLHHHAPDFFTSVQVTQDIPAGVSFGPCALHNTFYDTIAFIALKSFDRGGKAYVFRVDPDALKSSPLVVPWLRLVQAAIDTEEQNTEAYLKGGQLFFRTIRDINQGEELLVWYDEDLSHLLGFNDIKTTALTDGYSCGKCGLAFKHEHPFLAHCRFLCAHVATLRVDSEQKHAEARRLRSVTDFHNIARELEHKNKKSGSSEDRKRRHEEALSPRCRKPVLLEKKNIANNNNNITHTHKVGPHDQEPTIKVVSSLTSENVKNSAFAETKKAKSEQPAKSEDISRENPDVCSLQSDRQVAFGLQSDSSAFLVWSANAEQRSAFCKPNKLSINEDRQHQRPIAFSDDVSEHTALGYRNTPSLSFQGDLPSISIVSPASMSAPGSFHYAPDVWCRNIGGPLQTTSSLSILPPTLNSLGVTVQNWCAKCNLSFRMTSDLVFHMRSHHKKEFAAEAQGRRRREEKLTCPICHEYFRERHHLSRHMTSHN